MSYLVLARKWRPKNFSEVVGQQHVLQALINGLNQNRLHHAFLFAGTRGVGKTTLARIFAKSLNCEQGVSAEPCGECQSCVEVDQGRFVDLIEVDAASRTKVDDTREILDNVQYAPSRGRYKVYLIDEVHMLSTSSFNALLKTLEEPPPHVKFLFATTDPQKLPVTILSRCLQFNLRRMELNQISDHLAYILKQEQIHYDTEALAQLARAADGSMRDALSLLDQAIAFTGSDVTNDVIFQMLGSISQDQLIQMLIALAEQDAPALINQCQELAKLGRDFVAILDNLLTALQQMATLQLIPNMDMPESLNPEIANLATRFSQEQVQLLYQIALHGKRDISWAATPQSGFEMTLLRMLSFHPAVAETESSHVKKSSTAEAKPTPTPIHKKAIEKPVVHEQFQQPPAKKMISEPTVSASHRHTQQIEEPPPIEVTTSIAPKLNITKANWTQLIAELKLSALSRQLADHCSFIRCDGNTIYLTVSPELLHLATDKSKTRLQTALCERLGENIKLLFEEGHQVETEHRTLANERAEQQAIKQQQAIESIHNDPTLETLKNTFNARIIENSIKPRNTDEVTK